MVIFMFGFYASLRDNHENLCWGKVSTLLREGGHYKGAPTGGDMEGGISWSWIGVTSGL